MSDRVIIAMTSNLVCANDSAINALLCVSDLESNLIVLYDRMVMLHNHDALDVCTNFNGAVHLGEVSLPY